MIGKTLKFSMLSLGVLAGGLLSSCSVNDTPAGNESGKSMLAAAPKVNVYSGEGASRIDWTPGYGGTKAVDVNANMWGETWDCPIREAKDLTAEELEELKGLLSPGKPVENEIIISWENYWVQQIYKGEDSYNTHDRCTQAGCDHVNNGTELGSGHMEHLQVYDPSTVFDWRAEDGYQGAYYNTTYQHINNFNYGDNTSEGGECCTCKERHSSTTLLTDMTTEGVTPNNQFGFDETFGTAPKFFNNYYIVEYKGYYYVGFDYEAHKNDQNTHNHGEGLDIERDWCFTDWIVRICPAYPKGTTPKANPGGVQGSTDVTCDKCGDSLQHHNDEGICSDCEAAGRNNSDCLVGNGTGTTPPGEGTDEPDEPGTLDPATPDHNHNNEVEVNLHATDKKNNDLLESHLSIHVRAATDVEIFIPIPEEFYLDADDMAIVMQHEPNHMYHGETHKTTWTLKDSDLVVTVNIEYLPEGIRIWTEGITQEVIDWCMEKCNDGITFEIWNYFDPKAIDLDTLKDYLNQATIKFLDECPDAYINAFTEVDGSKNPDDCKVSIVDEQRDEYDKNPEIGGHLNGSDKNVIYNKSIVEEDPSGN